jgi:hypothetical protein
MNIRSDYATLYRPDPQDERRKVMYDYRGGWGDPNTPSTVDADDRVVDLAKFDFEAILGVLRGAPETLNMQRADVDDTWVDISPSKDPLTPDAVNVMIYVTSDFGSGYIDLAPDGAVKRINYPS